MKRRRWLPVVALAALGATSLLACIVSLDDGPVGVKTDAGASVDASAGDASTGGSTHDGPTGDAAAEVEADAVADAATDANVACSWDGASPAVLLLHGVSFPDHIHVDIVEGAGPAFHVHVGDKNVPIANGAEIGTFPPCTTSFDDDGGAHPMWGDDDGGLTPNYDFLYQLTIFTADDQQDPSWTYEPGIDVQARLGDGSASARTDVLATCPIDASMCSQVPP